MTRERNDKKDTPFGKWLRANPAFDSKNGYDAENLDYIWHNYMLGKLMLIEEKRYKAERSFPQKDTHGVVDELIRLGAQARQVKNAKGATVEYCGYHVVQFENTSPDDGAVYIDGKLVTQEQLVLFLNFEPW